MPVLRKRLEGRRGRARAAAATAAVAAMTATMATACGSASPTSAVASPRACAPGVTDTEIKFGILYPDTGLMATQFTGFRAGIDARIDAANAEGGVGGRQVTTVWRDDEFSATGNMRAAQELLRDGVFAVAEYTGYSGASASLLRESGVPVLGVADDDSWSTNPNMFPVAYLLDGNETTTTLGQFIRSQGGTTAAIIASSVTESARVYSEGARRSLEAAGIRIAYLDLDASTHSSDAVARIVRSGADSIVSLAPFDLYTGVLAAASQAGRPYRVAVSPITYDANLLNTSTGRALAGTFAPVGYTVLERRQAPQQAYLNTMTTYAPEMQPVSQLSSVYGYIAADMFLRGLRAQDGCPTRDGFIQGLRGITDYDGAGLLTQRVDLSATDRGVDLCSDFVRLSDAADAFEPVGTGPLCGQPLGGGGRSTTG